MGVPRATEMTIRDLLQEELRKRGVTVVPEVSIATPVGRLMPDMVLRNGAEYVVETKLGTVADLLKAVIKLGDYKKYSGAKGAFAVLFPEQLRRPWDAAMLRSIALDPSLKYTVTYTFDDFRPSGSFEGSLAQIADWIARQVLKPLPIEVETSFAIRILRGTVHYVTGIMRQLKGEQLEDIFGGKTVFENILRYEEGKYPLEQMRQAATYLLINQLLFYHVLARVGIFEPIDEAKIEKPSDLAGYFEQVLRKDYSAVFGFDVASRLPVNATEMVRNVVKIIGVLSPEKIRHDLLGKVFHELIPYEIRKAVAAFYTNNEAAEILAQLAIDKPDAKVMDLAVGSGTLLVAAYRRKRELLQKVKGTIELEDHKRFLEQDLTGIDIMPFAAHLAVVHLSLQTLLYETEKVRIAVWDSTELKPGETIPAIWSELKAAYRKPTLDMFAKGELPEKAYVTKGTVTLEGVGGERIPLEQADLVIMNPPFTRQERLPKAYKEKLSNRLVEYKDFIHRQLGLYGYFVLLADRFVKAGGRIALVLPATILRLQSAKGIRKLLIQGYQIEFMITTWQRAAFSEGAQFREILLIAKKLDETQKKRGFENLKCSILKLKKLPKNMEEARAFAHQMDSITDRSALNSTFTSDSMSGRIISQKELRNTIDNWFIYVSCYDENTEELWDTITKKGMPRFQSFEKVLAKTGGRIFEGTRARSHMIRAPIGSLFIVRHPERAKKLEDRWVLKSLSSTELIVEDIVTQETMNIPAKSVEYGLRRLSGIDVIDLSDDLDFIVTGNFKGMDDYFLNIGRVPSSEELLAWRKYVKEKLSKLAIAARFDISAKGTSLFSWYSAKPMAGCGVVWNIKGLNDKVAKMISIWFNSSINVLQLYLKRIETRGAWMRLDKYVINKLLVLDPISLSKQKRKTLFSVFDNIKNEAFPSFLEQLKKKYYPRVMLDKAILKILGFDEKDAEQLIDKLYPALAKEIEQLKTLMQERK